MKKTMKLTVNGQSLNLSERQALDLQAALSEAREKPEFTATRSGHQGIIKAAFTSGRAIGAIDSNTELTDC